MKAWLFIVVAGAGCRQLFGIGDPTLSQGDAAVDGSHAMRDAAVDGSVATKQPVACATTGSFTSATTGALGQAGADTITSNSPGGITAIDGYKPLLDDRILIKSETTWQQQFHGIWVVVHTGGATVPWMLTRAPDSRTAAQLQDEVVMVQNGMTNGGTTWRLTNTSASLAAFDLQFTGSTMMGGTQIANVDATVVTTVRAATGAGAVYLGYYNSMPSNNLANSQIVAAAGTTIDTTGANASASGSVGFVASPVLTWVSQ